MNTQEYIDSGILEVYAAGGLTDTERADVDRWASLYPEVKAALDEAQRALEAYALSYTQMPPAHLQHRILQHLQQLATAQTGASEESTTEENLSEIPTNLSQADVRAQVPVGATSPEAKVISMEEAVKKARQESVGQKMRVAAMLLLLVSAATNFYLYFQWKGSERELAIAQQSVKQYAYETSQLEYRTDRSENFLALIRDPQTKAVSLKGVPRHATAAAKVFWNQETKEVFFDPAALPTAPQGKQYQLWALVDGKPINAGLVATSQDPLLRMKTMENAQAFAVTLEPMGGSESPTMEAMYVMGSI